jgi:hypothetical protein
MSIKIGDKVKIKRGTWNNNIFYIGDVTAVVAEKFINTDNKCLSMLSIDDEFRAYFLSNGFAADYFWVRDSDLKKISTIKVSGWKKELIKILGI